MNIKQLKELIDDVDDELEVIGEIFGNTQQLQRIIDEADGISIGTSNAFEIDGHTNDPADEYFVLHLQTEQPKSTRCKVCGYRLDDYGSKCDTCGACIDMGHECSCGCKGEKESEK